MKILHIASGNSGGAFRSATNLYKIQKLAGNDVYFLGNLDRSTYKKIVSKLNTFCNQILTYPKFGVMSLSSINGLSTKQIRKINPDVIHIHNWFNLLSIRQMIKLSAEFPIVITMHDERLLTGGCHNHLDCQDFLNNCKECPATRLPLSRIVRKRKVETIKLLHSQKIRIISPSQWLKTEVVNSSQGKSQPRVIPNPFSIEFYEVHRATVHKPVSENLKLLFVAANPWVPLKGLNGLIEVLSEIMSEGSVRFDLTVVGKSPQNISVPKFVNIAGPLEPSELINRIQDSDFLVVPSFSENSPGVIPEAQSLGKVVVATNVGGIPEMVIDSQTGFIQQKGESLKELLKRAMLTPIAERYSIGLRASIYVNKKLSKDHLVKETIMLYQEAINEAR